MSKTAITADLHPSWDHARSILAGVKQALRMSIAGQVLLGQELIALRKDLGYTHGGDRRSSGHDVHLKYSSWSDWVSGELGVSYKTADRFIAMADAAKARLKKIGHTGDLPGGTKKLALILDARPSTLNEDDRQRLADVVEKITCGTSQKELLEELKMVKHAERPQIGGDTSAHRKESEGMSVEQLAFTFLCPLADDLRRTITSPQLPTYLSNLPLDGEDGELTLATLETQTRELLREIEMIRETKQAALKRAR